METDSRGPLERSLSVVDWLDATETQLAQAYEQSLEDDQFLHLLSRMWRTHMGRAAAMPQQLRLPPTFAPVFGRGGDTGIAFPHPGAGLAEEYPSDLLTAIKTSWATAARALAFQQACVPFGAGQAKDLQDLAQVLDEGKPPAFAPTPSRMLLETDGLLLRELFPDEGRRGEPIVLVASLINRWYVLDFVAGQSFMEMLGRFGRPVYLAEWMEPRRTPDDRTIADLCDGPLQKVLTHVRTLHGQKPALMGYSMGGTIATMMAARYPQLVARLGALCATVLFAKGGLFARWFSKRHLDVDLVCAAHEVIPSWLVHLPFWWLRPTVKVARLVSLSRSFRKPGYIDNFLATEVWNQDNIDLARGVFRSWAGQMYQDDALIKGDFTIAGEKVDLGRIDQPLLVVSCANDKITPAEAAEPLLEKVRSSVRRSIRLECGHVAVITSKRSLAALEPEIVAWLEAPLVRTEAWSAPSVELPSQPESQPKPKPKKKVSKRA